MSSTAEQMNRAYRFAEAYPARSSFRVSTAMRQTGYYQRRIAQSGASTAPAYPWEEEWEDEWEEPAVAPASRPSRVVSPATLQTRHRAGVFACLTVVAVLLFGTLFLRVYQAELQKHINETNESISQVDSDIRDLKTAIDQNKNLFSIKQVAEQTLGMSVVSEAAKIYVSSLPEPGVAE